MLFKPAASKNDEQDDKNNDERKSKSASSIGRTITTIWGWKRGIAIVVSHEGTSFHWVNTVRLLSDVLGGNVTLNLFLVYARVRLED